MDHLDELETELRDRLARQPPDRFPIQHATACFHLGTFLAGAGRLEEAEEVLQRADELFRPHLPVEHAKVRNAVGALHRAAGRHDDAAETFRHAAGVFDAHDQTLDAGAAWFNLGLVERERGDLGAASDALSAARARLDPNVTPAVAASAARELGSLLLERGELTRARQEAQVGLEVSRRLGDHAAVGHAANVVGLVALAAGDAGAAAEAFRTASAAHPRAVRPEDHAMATANLALAHERGDQDVQARFAARQSLAVPAGSGPAHRQARGVLERLGDPPGELARVLEVEERERWPELVRVELGRWAGASPDARRREAGAWISAQAAAQDPVGHAVVLVGGLLELPHDELQQVVDALVDEWVRRDEPEREAFRAQVSRAVVRFHVPQWMRLRSVLDAAARARGDTGGWG